MIRQILNILNKVVQINSQLFLFAEVGKLAVKIHSYLDKVRQEDNRELAKKLSLLNKTISEATKNGDIKALEDIVSGIGIPNPK